MTEMRLGPNDERIAQYRVIIDQLLDRGRELSAIVRRALDRGGDVLESGVVGPALENVTEAVMNAIRLDHALDHARNPDPRLIARMVASICRRLEAAAAILPDVPPAPAHASTAALRDRARRLAARKR